MSAAEVAVEYGVPLRVLDACPNDCGDHCGNPSWTREMHEARADRLKPLADHLRLGHDVVPEDRRYQDTWLHIALLADEWFTARSEAEQSRPNPPTAEPAPTPAPVAGGEA